MNRRVFLKRTLSLAGGASVLGSVDLGADAEVRVALDFDKLHRESVVVDAFSAVAPGLEIEKIQRGGIDVVVQTVSAEELLVRIPPQKVSESPPPGMNIWEDVFKGPEVVKRVTQGIDQLRQNIDRNQDRLALALDSGDVTRIVQSGRIAIILMLESGWINSDLAVLQNYYRQGLRVMALCHVAAFDWVDSTLELNAKPGLSDFGRSVVRECNRLGILVDLSHASDQSTWDAIAAATKPPYASHTKCRALSGATRDLTDEMIRAIAGKGGVIGVLAAGPRPVAERTKRRVQRDLDLLARYPDPFALAAAMRANAVIWDTELDLESIDHAVKLAGIDHVSLSSHCINVPQWRDFTEALMTHGYSEQDAKKILGGNLLRLFEQTLGPAKATV